MTLYQKKIYNRLVLAVGRQNALCVLLDYFSYKKVMPFVTLSEYVRCLSLIDSRFYGVA